MEFGDYAEYAEFQKNPKLSVNKADFDLLKRHLRGKQKRYAEQQKEDNVSRILCYHYNLIVGYIERLEQNKVLVICD